MKNIFFIILLSSGSCIIQAQNVGIGTTNPQKILHIDAAKNNASAPPAPPARDIRNDDDFSVGATGNVSIGTITPVTRLDIRSADIINPQDAIGIGNTTQTANDAGAGALKYYPSAPAAPEFIDGHISYSDAVSWSELEARIPNDFVYAVNASGQSLANNATTKIANWTETEDVNGSFDPVTGEFTAVKNGNYLVSFTYATAASSLGNNTRAEAIISTDSTSPNTNTVFKCVNSYPGPNVSIPASGQCSGIFNLNKGDKISVSILNQLNSAKTLHSDSAYTSLSIFGI